MHGMDRLCFENVALGEMVKARCTGPSFQMADYRDS